MALRRDGCILHQERCESLRARELTMVVSFPYGPSDFYFLVFIAFCSPSPLYTKSLWSVEYGSSKIMPLRILSHKDIAASVLVVLSLGSLALGVASCLSKRHLSSPVEKFMCWRTVVAFCQQPKRSEGPQTTVLRESFLQSWSSSNGQVFSWVQPSLWLDCNFMGDSESEPSS